MSKQATEMCWLTFRWLTYFVETERFDRSLPGQWRDECWIPFDRVASIRFAQQASNRLPKCYQDPALDRSAKQYVERIPFDQQCRLLDQMHAEGFSWPEPAHVYMVTAP